MRKTDLNKHMIMGYVFLALVFLGAISSVYYWEYKASAENPQQVPKHVESGEQSPQVYGASCGNGTVLARQKETGEVREFPSLCHVIENWEVIK